MSSSAPAANPGAPQPPLVKVAEVAAARRRDALRLPGRGPRARTPRRRAHERRLGADPRSARRIGAQGAHRDQDAARRRRGRERWDHLRHELPNQLVLIDRETLKEVGRVTTGKSPDGVGWDPAHKVVGVSDQGDGALSLIPDSGHGEAQAGQARHRNRQRRVRRRRGWFWITVVGRHRVDRLVAVDPVGARVTDAHRPARLQGRARPAHAS